MISRRLVMIGAALGVASCGGGGDSLEEGPTVYTNSPWSPSSFVLIEGDTTVVITGGTLFNDATIETSKGGIRGSSITGLTQATITTSILGETLTYNIQSPRSTSSATLVKNSLEPIGTTSLSGVGNAYGMAEDFVRVSLVHRDGQVSVSFNGQIIEGRLNGVRLELSTGDGFLFSAGGVTRLIFFTNTFIISTNLARQNSRF